MFVRDYLFSEKENNILLEPLSCIFRMILLNYKEEGTKISILNHSIQYNEYNLYQGLIRSINGDTREDLHNLYNPFLKSFEWYSVDQEYFQYFYQKCYDGISKLLGSYKKGSTIHHTLKHYCTIFNNILEKNPITEKIEDEKESPLLDEFKTFWKERELKIIYEIFNYLDDCSDQKEKQTYFIIIDTIITMKEQKVSDYIKQSSTSYH